MTLTLPPRGVFVPTHLIYSPGLPAAALQTWVQLRGLAGKRSETPPFGIKELSQLTGKSPSALYGHLAQLKARGALRWRNNGNGLLTVMFDNGDPPAENRAASPADLSAAAPAARGAYGDTTGETHTPKNSRPANPRAKGEGWVHSFFPPFPEWGEKPSGDDPGRGVSDFQNSRIQESGIQDSRFLESGIQESGIQESGIQISSSSSSSSDNINLDSEEEEGKDKSLQDSRILEKRPAQAKSSHRPAHSDDPVTGDHTGSTKRPDRSDDPAAIYQAIMGRLPTPSQRKEIHAKITDPDLWRKSLAHWQMHAWNPRNLPSILDFYTRGGPAACRSCAPRTAPADPFDEIIADYRRQKGKHGRPG